MRKIVKCGGAVLATPEHIRRIAASVRALREDGNEVAVVVSAMGDRTNALHKSFLEATGGKFRPEDFERYIILGEVEAAELFAATLNSAGVPARAFTPFSDLWPIVVRMPRITAAAAEKINEEKKFTLNRAESIKRVKRGVLKDLKAGRVPVVCGFAALDTRGHIVTLGRGGSDLSAVLLAKLLDAEEIVLVKDVEGVYSADPRLARQKRRISVISSRDLEVLTRSGSRVVHPSSLRLMPKDTTLRIVSYKDKDWDESGTEVRFEESAAITKTPHPVAVITFIGHDFSRYPSLVFTLASAAECLKIPILSISFTDEIIAFYLPEKKADEAYVAMTKGASRVSAITSSTVRKGLGRITMSSSDFIHQPGAVARVVAPIARAGINIWEIVTVHSDIHLYIDFSDLDPVLSLLRSNLR